MEIIQYKNHTIKIYQDTCPQNPREDYNIGTIVGRHKNYDVVDKDFASDRVDNWEDAKILYFLEEYYSEIYEYLKARTKFVHRLDECINSEEDLPKYLKKLVEQWIRQNIINLNVYLYDHGGIAISTNSFSCRWDSGQVGFIYYKGKEIEAKAEQWLKAEIDTFNTYLQGDVYGYDVFDEDENLIDSCGGFFGSDHEESGLLECAKNSI